MALSYPHKQTVLIFIVCAIVIAGSVYYVGGHVVQNNRNTQKNSPSTVILDQTANGSSSKVTNEDWKKEFTDSTQPSNSFKNPATIKKDRVVLSDTVTDKFGREFFEKYMQLRQAGLNSDSDSINTAVEQIISDAANQLPSPVLYHMSDLHVRNTASDMATMQTYTNNISSILNTNLPSPDNNGAIIATEALEKGDMKALAKIDEIIAGYKATRDAMLSMSVPKEVAQYHLDLLNAISTELFNTESFRSSDTDPLRSLASVSTEISSLQNLNSSINKMRDYLMTWKTNI